MKEFQYAPLFPPDENEKTEYRQIEGDFVETDQYRGKTYLHIKAEGLRALAREAMTDVSFFLRTAHLEQVASILKDPEASENDRYVAHTLLRNSVVAAEMQLPTCQDTGTAIVIGKKGDHILTEGHDAEHLAHGIFDAYQERNLRYSQNIALNMYEEKNSGTNLPAQIDIHSVTGSTYDFLFLAKGGGSANKTFLYQKTRTLLQPEAMFEFLREKVNSLGTAACPPYHIAIVVGGTSAELNLKTVKLASTGALDHLPGTGNESGQAFRDFELEARVLQAARDSGIGAQFGGKYLAHDVRIIRLPRHGASCPVGLGLSCSADRNIKGRISAGGIFLERLERNPARLLPEDALENIRGKTVHINLNRPLSEILASLSHEKIGTRIMLSGRIIVARDIAHARLKERLERGESLPDYFRDHPIYYAGPAKKPEGMASGSFGPTTAGRMDPYVPIFQQKGYSLITLAKGNRSPIVAESCQKNGGFYLGSIGGPAAILAQESIKHVEVVEFPELGMEAVRAIDVENFPAFIVINDQGEDLFAPFR